MEKAEQDSCWSCGWSPVGSSTCGDCGLPVGPLVAIPLGESGMSVLLGSGLDARQGIVAFDSGETVQVIVKDRGVANCEVGAYRTGVRLDGVEVALSPAGAALFVSESQAPRWGHIEPEVVRDLAIEAVSDDLRRSRLLAVDSLRLGCGPVVLPRLEALSETERAWLFANYYADSGDWNRSMEYLEKLPDDRYLGRLGLLYRGRAFLREDRELAGPASRWLQQHVGDDPRAQLLARFLVNDAAAGNLTDIRLRTEGIAQLAPLLPASRAAGLSTALAAGKSVKQYSDVSEAVRPYEAVTSRRRWHAKPEDIRGRSLEFVDELIDRHRVPARSLTDFLEVLSEDERPYVTARIDPTRLSDEDVTELGMEVEHLRRLLLRGGESDLGEAAGGSAAVEKLQLKENALRGSVEALTQLRLELGEDEFRNLSEAADSIARRELPTEHIAGDLTLWPYFAEAVDRGTLLSVEKQEIGKAQATFVAWASLNGAKRSLFEWEPNDALNLSRKVLEMSRDEVLRDEALNLISAVHWHEERDKEALAAISTALEGLYTTSLQVNGVVVASTASERDGLEIMSKLIADAPDLGLRLSAARRVIGLIEGDGNEELPDSSASRALRQLVGEAISFDDFLPIAEFLANHDADWLKSNRALKSSPHRNRPETKVLQAKCEGLAEMFRALSVQLRADPQNPWLAREREQWLQILINSLARDPDVLGSASLGYEILDSQMPMDGADNVVLTMLCAREFAFAIDTSEGCLRDDRVDEAVAAMKRLDRLDREDQDRIGGLCDQCMASIVQHLIDFYQRQIMDSRPQAYLTPAANAALARQGTFWCRSAISTAENVKPAIRDLNARLALDQVVRGIRGMLSEFSVFY